MAPVGARWWAGVNAVMNPQGIYKVENFLIIYVNSPYMCYRSKIFLLYEMHKLIISFLYKLVFSYTDYYRQTDRFYRKPFSVFFVIVLRKRASAQLLIPMTPNNNIA